MANIDDDQVMCALCKHTTALWLASDAPPQVLFDTLSCLLVHLVSESVAYRHQSHAVDYIADLAKDMIASQNQKRSGMN